MARENITSSWLSDQDKRAVAIAQEIIKRRYEHSGRIPSGRDAEYLRRGRAFENGVISGLRLALSYLTDRPGDVSATEAEGFIADVKAGLAMLDKEESRG